MSAYGYDSRRRRRQRRAARLAEDFRRLRFWFRALLIAALLSLAAYAVVDDHLSAHGDDPTIIWNDPSPNPAAVSGHP